jgi:hypothetical protein
MQRNILIESKDTHAVVAQLNSPPKGQRFKDAPLVIMPFGLQKTHEYTPEFFLHIAKSLEGIGVTSLIYDFNEQQKDRPTEQELCCERLSEDLNTLYVWARENGFQKVAFITEGLGAPLIFLNLPENSIFTILLWPVLNLEEFAKAQKAESPDGFCVNDKFFEKMKELNLRAALQNAHTPTLILHGHKDTVIPPSHLEEARAHLMVPRLDITTIEDGEHGLASSKHEKACLQHISNFVKKYAQDDSDRIELFRI